VVLRSAEQDGGLCGRTHVALKVIQVWAMGQPQQVIGPFRGRAAKRLATEWNHPNHREGAGRRGVPKTGRPYFVMELVRWCGGLPRFCNGKTSSPPGNAWISSSKVLPGHPARATKKGIIPPATIKTFKHPRHLSTMGVPVPQSHRLRHRPKAIEGTLTDGTVYTQLLQFVGTPGLHESRAGGDERTGPSNNPQRYLQPGRTPLRTAHRPDNRLMARNCWLSGIDAMRKTISGDGNRLRPSTRLNQTLVAGRRKEGQISFIRTHTLLRRKSEPSSRRLLQN